LPTRPETARLLRTTAVRVALRYAVLYAVLAGAALAVFHWASGTYIDAQLKAGLREDYEVLRDRLEAAGPEGLEALLQARSEAAEAEGRYYLLVDPAGRRLGGNLTGWPPASPIPLDGQVHVVWLNDEVIPGETDHDNEYWPAIATRFADGSRLLVTRDVHRAERLQLYSLTAIVVLMAIIVGLAVTMGWFTGRTILRHIDAITATARDIMAGDLARRMPVKARGDEFDALSERLNQMLDRIEQLMNGMRGFTDDVAHDLRIPLTRLRNRLEVTLLEPRDAAEYRQVMEQAIQDADGIVATFNAILRTSRAEVGTLQAAMGPVDLSDLARQMGELYEPLAEDREQRLGVDADGPVTVTGQRDLLAQAIGNLLDNAIKYTPAGGEIRLGVEDTGAVVCLAVSDNGPGIPAPDRERVIQRFVRLDAARNAPGNGLGLTLVDAIVRQHGARLTLSDNRPGLRAVITFPPRPPGAPGGGAPA
jgi:signal transduction histidine kinase